MKKDIVLAERLVTLAHLIEAAQLEFDFDSPSEKKEKSIEKVVEPKQDSEEQNTSFDADILAKIDDISDYFLKKLDVADKKDVSSTGSIVKSIKDLPSEISKTSYVGKTITSVLDKLGKEANILALRVLLASYADIYVFHGVFPYNFEDDSKTVLIKRGLHKEYYLNLSTVGVEGSTKNLFDFIIERLRIKPEDTATIYKVFNNLANIISQKLYAEGKKDVIVYFSMKDPHQPVIYVSASVYYTIYATAALEGLIQKHHKQIEAYGSSKLEEILSSKDDSPTSLHLRMEDFLRSRPTSKTAKVSPYNPIGPSTQDLLKNENLTTFNFHINNVFGYVQNYDEDNPKHENVWKYYKDVIHQFQDEMKRKAPKLLKYLPPVCLEMSYSYRNAVAWYDDGNSPHGKVTNKPFVVVFLSNYVNDESYPSKKISVRGLAHECGHHWFRHFLTEDQKDLWIASMRDKEYKAEMSYQRILDYAEKHNLKNLKDVVKHLVESGDAEDRLLGLRMNVVMYKQKIRHGRDEDVNTLDMLKKAVNEGNVPSGSGPLMPLSPVSPYGHTNPEEGFCEAVGIYIAFGRNAVHPYWLMILEECLGERRFNVHASVVENKVNSELLSSCRIAQRLLTLAKTLLIEEESSRDAVLAKRQRKAFHPAVPGLLAHPKKFRIKKFKKPRVPHPKKLARSKKIPRRLLASAEDLAQHVLHISNALNNLIPQKEKNVVISKFWNGDTSVCGYCLSPLVPTRIVENKKHVYTIGQMLECSCGKSKIWTNSIRNEKAFIKSVEENSRGRYYQGFCNDMFCGFTFEPLDVLKNGEKLRGYRGRTDRYGCNTCRENQNIHRLNDIDVPGGNSEWDSFDGPDKLYDWYKANVDVVKNLIS